MLGLTPLASGFLWGLTAVSLPVIIHMMQSPRARQIEFPSIRFLKACQKRATRRTRLKNIILMLMRMALIALICLGMAKPWRKKEETTVLPDAPVSMVIVLDNSYSMGYLDKGSSRFEQARQAAGGLVDSLKPGDEAAVVLMNETAVPCVREFTTDHERVKKALREAELSVLTTNVDPAVREAIRLAARAGSAVKAAAAGATTDLSAAAPAPTEPPAPKGAEDDSKEARRRREIHILTDLQANGWETLLKSNFLKTVETKANIFLSSFGRKGSPNCFVESATITSSGADECTITAQVRAVGAGSPGNIVTLSVNGKNVTQETFAVRPGAPTSVPLIARFRDPGTHRCMVSLQDDSLALDDRYYFTVDVGERSSVLVVDGDPSAVAPLSETYYLRAALNPGLETGGEGAAAIDARLIPLADLPATKLDDLRCVILCNVPHIDGGDLVKLETYLREGGSVLIFLGGLTNAEQFNQWTFMPLTLTKPVGDPSKRQSFGLGEIRGDHPVFSRKLDFRSARFFVCFGSLRSTLKQGGAVVASFTNGEPAFVEGRFGKGKVLLFTSTCDLEWNNFPLRRVFLPWLHQAVYYLSNQDTKGKSYRLKEKITFQAVASHYKDTVTVTDPSNRKVILRPQVKGGYAEAAYEATDLPGLYQVAADPAFSNAGGFGVNLDVKESVIDVIESEKITAVAPPGLVKVLDAPGRSVVAELKKTREGDEFWPLLFKLALLMFIVESLFGNLISAGKRPGGVKTPLFEVLRQRNPGIAQ